MDVSDSLIFLIGKWFLLTKCVLYNQKHIPFTKKKDFQNCKRNHINLAKSHTSRCEMQSVMDEAGALERQLYTEHSPLRIDLDVMFSSIHVYLW